MKEESRTTLPLRASVKVGLLKCRQRDRFTGLHCAPLSCLSLVNGQGCLMHHLININLHCAPAKCPPVQSQTDNFILCTIQVVPDNMYMKIRLVHHLISTKLHFYDFQMSPISKKKQASLVHHGAQHTLLNFWVLNPVFFSQV